MSVCLLARLSSYHGGCSSVKHNISWWIGYKVGASTRGCPRVSAAMAAQQINARAHRELPKDVKHHSLRPKS